MTFKRIHLPHPEGPHHGFGKFLGKKRSGDLSFSMFLSHEKQTSPPMISNDHNFIPSFLGFTFINGQKHETYYASQTERAWREADELANEGLWDEAWTRYKDYCDLCSNSSRPDVSLMNKIITGLNMSYIETNISNLSKEERQKKFKEVIKSQQRNLYNDSGSNIETIAKEYGDIIDKYADLIQLTKYPITMEHSDVSYLVEVGDIWLGFCDSIFGIAAYFTEDHVGQRPYEKVHSIAIALAKKKEYKHAVETCKRMLNSHNIKIQSPRYYCMFQVILAECSEVLGHKMEAQKAYSMVHSTYMENSHIPIPYDNIGESAIGISCPSGTLLSRIDRTKQEVDTRQTEWMA